MASNDRGKTWSFHLDCQSKPFQQFTSGNVMGNKSATTKPIAHVGWIAPRVWPNFRSRFCWPLFILRKEAKDAAINASVRSWGCVNVLPFFTLNLPRSEETERWEWRRRGRRSGKQRRHCDLRGQKVTSNHIKGRLLLRLYKVILSN